VNVPICAGMDIEISGYVCPNLVNCKFFLFVCRAGLTVIIMVSSVISSYVNDLSLLAKLDFMTKSYSQVVNTLASYLRGLEFKSQQRDFLF
jgi:hypothetical protein